jgi:hypothetical protein
VTNLIRYVSWPKRLDGGGVRLMIGRASWPILNRGRAGHPRRAFEPSNLCTTSLRYEAGMVCLEIAIEPPDQCTGSALGQALLIGKGVELVNQALGVNPAQGVLTAWRIILGYFARAMLQTSQPNTRQSRTVFGGSHARHANFMTGR